MHSDSPRIKSDTPQRILAVHYFLVMCVTCGPTLDAPRPGMDGTRLGKCFCTLKSDAPQLVSSHRPVHPLRHDLRHCGGEPGPEDVLAAAPSFTRDVLPLAKEPLPAMTPRRWRRRCRRSCRGESAPRRATSSRALKTVASVFSPSWSALLRSRHRDLKWERGSE